MAASCISNATSPHGFLIPPHRYLRDRQSEEQRAGGCLLPHGNACPREQGDGALANGTAAFRGGRRSRDSSESGTLLGVGPGLCRTSENSVKAKFSIAPAQRAQDRHRGSRIPRGIMFLMYSEKPPYSVHKNATLNRTGAV